MQGFKSSQAEQIANSNHGLGASTPTRIWEFPKIGDPNIVQE